MANIFLGPFPSNGQLSAEHSESQLTDPCDKQTTHSRIHLKLFNLLFFSEPIGDKLEQTEDDTNDKEFDDSDDHNDKFNDTIFLVGLQ